MLEERIANREDLAITNDRLESRSMNLKDMFTETQTLVKDDENESGERGDDGDDSADGDGHLSHHENCLVNAKIKIMQNVQLYRVKIIARSMVAVIFQDVSHDLRIFLTIGRPPTDLRQALAKSECCVLAGSKNTTMLIRNNCPTFGDVYMAIQVSNFLNLR